MLVPVIFEGPRTVASQILRHGLDSFDSIVCHCRIDICIWTESPGKMARSSISGPTLAVAFGKHRVRTMDISRLPR